MGWTSTKQGLMCLAQGRTPVTPVRLEPAAPRSGVKHSTTEPLRAPTQIVCKGYQKVKNSFFQNLISGKHQCQKFCVQIWTDILSELGPDYLQRLSEDITSWQGLCLFFLQKSSFRNTISVI